MSNNRKRSMFGMEYLLTPPAQLKLICEFTTAELLDELEKRKHKSAFGMEYLCRRSAPPDQPRTLIQFDSQELQNELRRRHALPANDC